MKKVFTTGLIACMLSLACVAGCATDAPQEGATETPEANVPADANVPAESSEEVTSDPILVNSVTKEQGIVYTLYVGLVDAQVGHQVLTIEEAEETAKLLVAEVGAGYTVTRAEGGFMDESGHLQCNDTLIFTGLRAEEAEVLQLVEDIKTELGIYSVYVESEVRGYTLFGGQLL